MHLYRPAKSDDVDRIVPLLYAAAPKLYDFVYGPSALEYLHYEFVQGWGRVGWRRCWVAEQDRDVVASIVRLDWLSYHTSEAWSALDILRYFGLTEGLGILCRGLSMRRLIPPVRFRSFFPQNLGVDPTMRSRGIGEGLLRHMVDIARAEGYRWLSFDVMADNRAWNLYQRMGFSHIHRTYTVDESGLGTSYRVCVRL